MLLEFRVRNNGSEEQKIQYAQEMKEEGNIFYQNSDIDSAESSYIKAIGVFLYFKQKGEDIPLIDVTPTMSPSNQVR